MHEHYMMEYRREMSKVINRMKNREKELLEEVAVL